MAGAARVTVCMMAMQMQPVLQSGERSQAEPAMHVPKAGKAG